VRIGIDATSWANPRGYGRYTREILRALVPLSEHHTLVCLLDELSATSCDLDAPHIERVVVKTRVPPTVAAAAGGGRSPADMWAFTRATSRAKLDVFYSPSVYGYFPLPPGLPAAVTIHDAIAERFPHLTLPSARDRWFWNAKVWLAVRQARLILTVSEHAAGQIAQYLRVAPGKLRVTLEGVAPAYVPSETRGDIERTAAAVGLPPGGRWLIYVGGFGPHKHVDVLVQAHAAASARIGNPTLSLILVGPSQDAFHDDVAGIRRTVEACGSTARVFWPGYLPDDTVRHLHSGALALVLASAAEGFGLPAVEAARCGTPVIATLESPLPQVLEGGGLFVAPSDVEALTQAIVTMATDEARRAAMGRRALERASVLSWERSAGVVLAAIEEAARTRS
jgi:glycosyltransferase involved in cell wall biosynthesis